MELFDKLKEPFPKDEIKWRVGATTKDKKKGIALAYIDSRAVMDRLDKVISPENWKDEYKFGPNGEIVCELSLKINDEWVTKADGAGQTKIESEKGGLSDAFKRSAVKWGIGRYLYHLPTKWVQLDKYKKIKNPPSLPKWALPNSPQDNKESKLGKDFDQWQKQDYLKKIRDKFKENKPKLEPIMIKYIEDKGYQGLEDISSMSNEELEELYQKVS